MCVLLVDKAGVKRALIETNKTQSNMSVSDEDLVKNPELAKAAVLAELLRWIDNTAVQRQSKKDAWNLLTSRYVFTWKLQTDGTRIMKCRLTVHGFKDMERGSLDKFSGTASSWGQRAVVATAVQSEWPIAS